MGYDAISNAHVCAYAKVSSKKKRGNKLKQNKLGCKREQFFIQDNNKECKMEGNGIGGAHPSSIPKVSKEHQTQRHLPRMTRDVHEVLPIHNNEVITWNNSSINRKSGCAYPGNDFHRIRGRSSISGSSSSGCSEDDRDKGCLDDWEAVADALNSHSGKQVLDLEHHNQSESLFNEDGSQCVNRDLRAWSPDDIFRPRSLPRISTQQNSLTQNSKHDFYSSPAISSWTSWQRVAVPELQPSVCPICCEDFDVTDSSFLPCPCGFRLCLFCHKRILEVDGRCPGCRKHYGSVDAGPDLACSPSRSQLTDPWSKNTMS